jgi:hypothetical protein
MRLRLEFRHRFPRLERCANLCRAAGGALEQVELLVGACVFETTERYLESSKYAAARLSRGRTGLGSRAERQDQAPNCRLRALVRPEIPLTSRHRSFQSCRQSGHAKQDFMHTIPGVPESRIGTPILSADFMSGAYASCSGVYQALGIDTRNQRKATERA